MHVFELLRRMNPLRPPQNLHLWVSHFCHFLNNLGIQKSQYIYMQQEIRISDRIRHRSDF